MPSRMAASGGALVFFGKCVQTQRSACGNARAIRRKHGIDTTASPRLPGLNIRILSVKGYLWFQAPTPGDYRR